jgi:hypothetical protein
VNLLKLKFRKRVFRSFRAWYSTNHVHFGRKLSVIERTETHLVLAVEGIPSQVMSIMFAIGGGKSRLLDVSASFHLNGECLDSAGWFDAAPLRVAGGYRCGFCDDQGSTSAYPSLEVLWENHVFEPLMAWINKDLTNLIRLDFCKTSDGGMSWVDLVQDEAIRKADEAIASFSMPTIPVQKRCLGDIDVSA